MDKTNGTGGDGDIPPALSAVLDEMRDGIHTGRADIIDVVNERLRSYADRIEPEVRKVIEEWKAVARVQDKAQTVMMEEIERLRAPGSVSAMREALESIIENLAIHIKCGRFSAPGDHVSFPIIEAEAYIRDARAALSAPARNCDVGTAEEQTRRLRANCEKYKPSCNGCKFLTDIQHESCWLKWAQMPYEEGDAE